jgi:hypothetical protein
VRHHECGEAGRVCADDEEKDARDCRGEIVVVSSNRFDGAGTMTFTTRDDRIASLVIKLNLRVPRNCDGSSERAG